MSVIACKNYIKHLFFALILSVSANLLAQPVDNDTKLANHYFDKGEFEKAEIYYERAYKNYDSQLYYDRYFQCLFNLEKYEECEKLVEKRIKKDPYSIDNQFKLASVYTATSRENLAEEVYTKLISDLKPIRSRVDDLGERFQLEGMYPFALETYLQGRKILKDGEYGFQLELAGLYGLMNRPTDMISEYLNLLEYSPVYLKTVQTYLSRMIDFEIDLDKVELLRQEILLKVQKYPDLTVYNEMFIWYYLQKKEFAGAVLQAKSLDKKNNEQGKRLLEIGNVCKANLAYKDAAKAYQYVIDLGNKFPYYFNAMQAKLEVEFEELTLRKSYTKEELVVVAGGFERALVEMGGGKRCMGVMVKLAEIYAFYLDAPEKGILLIDQVLQFPLSPKEIAESKILKGDILVVNNEIWDASLLYMQVEKEFSEDIIGHEAKFKNAKVFYYDGEFDYAKAQLDVLKASTSKLIANDAMQLSLLLQDNLGIDTALAPVQLYANADLLLTQHKYQEAIILLDSLEKRYPFHSMIDEVLFKKGQTYEGLQNWEKAIENYTLVAESYSHDILGDDATFKLAQLYEYRLSDPQKAAEYYKKILFEFGGSLYTAEAREKYRAIIAVYN